MNTVHERYVGMLEMENLDANHIKNVMVKFLDSNELISKVIALATDGAAKMVSKKEGVFGKLKKIIPHLRSVHCVAHKVALGLSDLEAQFAQIRTVCKLIHRVSSFFSKSFVRNKAFDEAKKELSAKDLELLKPIDNRWLSNLRALKRVIELFPSVIQALTNIRDDPYADGLMINMTRFSQFTTMLILVDVLEPIDILCNTCQKKGIKICQILAAVDATIENLLQLKNKEESNFLTFMNSMIDADETHVTKIF
jgi:hypothetical protein